MTKLVPSIENSYNVQIVKIASQLTEGLLTVTVNIGIKKGYTKKEVTMDS